MSAHLSAVPAMPPAFASASRGDFGPLIAEYYHLAADLVRCGGPTPDGRMLALTEAEERTAHRLALLLEAHADAERNGS